MLHFLSNRFLPISSLCLFLFFCTAATAQQPDAKVLRYILRHSPQAKIQMAEYGIPASVIMAQAIFESAAGTSDLAKRSNNHFGIKCHTTWDGDTVTKTDDKPNECFRKYASVYDSYLDHSLFLSSRPWYAHLFTLSIKDYKAWCRGLSNAGYATFPHYAAELIKIIEKYSLFVLDSNTTMTPRRLASAAPEEIKNSHIVIYSKDLIEFTENGLLFSDETDIFLPSLDLLAGQDDDKHIMAQK